MNASEAITRLPYYIPSDLSERDIRDLFDSLIYAVRQIDKDRIDDEQRVQRYLDDIDFQGYVDDAVDDTPIAAEISDIKVTLQQAVTELQDLRLRFDDVMGVKRGPVGPQGVPGPQGPTGAMGPSGVDSEVFQGLLESMKDMEDRMGEIAQAVDELENEE
jgi:hypothetical protein